MPVVTSRYSSVVAEGVFGDKTMKAILALAVAAPVALFSFAVPAQAAPICGKQCTKAAEVQSTVKKANCYPSCRGRRTGSAYCNGC